MRDAKRVVIVGSGPIAESTLRELVETASGREPVGFLDDGSFPRRRRLRGLPRLGTDDELLRVLGEEGISEVFIAVPSTERTKIESAIRTCRAAGIPFRILSSVREHLDRPRSWELPDLESILAPEEAPIRKADADRDLFARRTILILGAGGQVGSALASRIAEADPAHLLLFDRNESPLYYLEVEFLKKGGMVPVTPLIGELVDEDRLRQIMRAHRPDIVIHAAAYTRTDLLSENREEIRENNLRGTEAILKVCDEEDVPRLFLLSCDESDTTEIACLHRAAERLLRRSDPKPNRVRAAVRFPSVLGSAGCAATRIARALQANGDAAPVSCDDQVRVAMLSSTVALLPEAFAIAGFADVLSIETGTLHTTADLLRTLQQVWNVPDAPARRPYTVAGHSHPIEPGMPTGHPRICRRGLAAEPSACVLDLLDWLDGIDSEGGQLLESSHRR
jgi:FlaA1/EpsC-like NDP-sugar epimerase